MVALCLSGSVLVMTFWPAVRDDHPKVVIVIVSSIVLLNVLLVVGCKVIILTCANSVLCNIIQTLTDVQVKN